MKKIRIIILWPYKFTQFDFFQLGLDLYKKKKVQIQIHELSNLFILNKFYKVWKSKSYKKKLIFKNILTWFFYIIKTPTHTIIFNMTNENHNAINSFFIKIILSFKRFSVFIFSISEVFDEKIKKNFSYFFYKIFKEHKYDVIFYLNFLKTITFSNLSKIVKYNKEIIFTNRNKIIEATSKGKIIRPINSFDYSNFLRTTHKENKNEKYFVYLDTGYPYFSGDYYLNKGFNHNNFINDSMIKKYMDNLIAFFNFLENKYKKKVLIVPHPKLRLLSSNRTSYSFFNDYKIFNKIDTNEAVRQAYCVLVNFITTSISYAVLNYKPIIFLKSKILESIMNINQSINEKKFLTILGVKSLSLNKGGLINKRYMTVNKKAYDQYKFKYLQNSNIDLQNKHNSDIITTYIKNASDF